MDLALIGTPCIHCCFPESQRHIHLLGGCQLLAPCPQKGGGYCHSHYLHVADGFSLIGRKVNNYIKQTHFNRPLSST